MKYKITKTYGHENGLSSTFRQWRAKSHCAQLHGYALRFDVTFVAAALDENGWVLDFGRLKPLKQFLQETFDHKLLIAADDPALDELCALASKWHGGPPVVDPVILDDGVGCEKFATLVADTIADNFENWFGAPAAQRVALESVEVREHGGNMAGVYFDV